MGTNITGIGNANAIGFKSRVTGGMYFPPELKDALVGVWSAYGKSNDSTDRNIIKNKIKDRGGDFELINFNYEGTSGYNGYPVVFGKDKTYQYVNHSPNYNQTTINVTHFNTRQALLYSYIQRNGELTSYNRDYPSYKIKVSGLEEGFGLMYQYNSKADATSVNALRIEANGIYTIPKSFASDGSLINANVWVGFVFTGTEQEQCNVTIEVLPEYKGAVVTDGVDDMIVSQNTVEEMGITDKFTVVSMIHQITLRGATAAALTNYIRRPIGYEYVRNHVANIGKTGIYGYAVYDVNHSSAGNSHIINTILGDKNDYSIHITGNLSQGKFSVQGYINGDNNAVELSQVAWYWTFIANKLLTEDEINLIIEKYNLDRPGEIVKPDVYYDIKRQKITNENHSSFDDELTDFSGNGHNMKLYNFGWEGNSGIGNYPVVFGANKTWEFMPTYNFIYSNNGSKIHITKVLHAGNGMLFSYVKRNDELLNIKEIPSFKVKVSGLEGNSTLRYSYIKTEDAKYQTLLDLNNGVHEVPKSLVPTDSIVNNSWIGFTIMPIYEEVREFDCDITIEVIPSNENAICLDGVDDYGKVTGLPILKDYTVAVDYERLRVNIGVNSDAPILSKSESQSLGAFMFNTIASNGDKVSYSFGYRNIINSDDTNRKIFYQSKYINNGQNIDIYLTFIDSDKLWLGTYRDNDYRFIKAAIYSIMSFPYSLSEFLLERQIKKARAGTLYPNQVEFRPIIPEDGNITRIDYFVVNSGTWTVIKPGDYVDVGARIVFNVYTKLPYKVEKVSSPAFTGMSVRHSTELNIFDVEGYIKDKTPQKIKLTLAVNEDIVQWNPTITSNLLDSFTASSWYLNGWDNTLTEGTWIKKTDRVFFKATFKTELYGLETATFGGAECVVSKADNWSDSKNIWDIRMLGTVGDLSQVFNLDVYELIRFEDIVQPYPSFYEFIDENKNLITWGSKIKVGSTITRTKGFFDSNLLKGLYTISYPKLNGVEASGSKYVVEKSMVFTCTATWIFDNNEPKCVLSPDRLQIPNSSYRILKHIPDISGHGNHGKINNSAYAEMSGANGYPYNYNNEEFAIQPGSEIINDTTFITHKLVPNVGMIKNTPLYKGKIKITGLNNKLALHVYAKGYLDSETINSYKIYKDGIYDINIVGVTEVIYFHVVSLIDDVQNRDVNVTIQQIGEYEGSFCLDGVDDFVTIPTTVGGKQVLMKVNWNASNAAILYDQRGYNNEFAIYNGTEDSDGNPVPAYQGRNNGQTYIDGILNSNIKASELKAIAHNITITNELSSGTNKTYPVIGSSKANAYFVNMALYDFMLFDEISTDDKIKELNEYIGIEKNVFAINPNISIDTPETVKDIKIYQGGEEISSGYLYLNKDTEFEIYVSLNTGKYSLDTITVDGVEITKDRVVGEYNIFKFTLNGSSEQNITIHSYEYIMYEDIVQPYPVLLRFNDKNGNEVSWGGKFKVGSTITRIGSIADPESNLLNGLYSISGLSLNGKAVTSSTSIVEKQMVFRTTATWLLGDNEPKCIFSPSKLRMPNESYRYLGYIPDISGNGNNGVFNNFAFSKMSGVNGYLEDFTTLRDYGIKGIVRTDSKIYLDESFDYDKGFWLGYTNVPSPAYKVKISGIPETGMLTYTGGVWLNLTNGINELPARTNTAENHGFAVQSPNLDWSNLVIEQIPEYEGSICFDGVDDYITIPTLSEGGKQVLMKVNWQKQDTMLYNQNPGQDNFAIFTNDYNNNNLVVAYASRNNGNTYIDGVVNNNILATQLKGITHNIVATNNNIDATITPIIGSNKNHDNFFAQMALYDFMLFDEISTDEEIKELNNIVGIEGDYVQKPSYYWDAYGKSNLDVDKGYIKDQVSLQLNNDTTNNNSLENFNFGYEGMSGYNGYPVIFGANKTWKERAGSGNDYIFTFNANKYHIKQVRTSVALNFSWIKRDGELTNYNKDIPAFKLRVIGLDSRISVKYNYIPKVDATSRVDINMTSDGIYELPKSFASDGSIDVDSWIGFSFSKKSSDVPDIVTDLDIIIEIIPEYENGLVYDGVDDYSENASIPLLSDYTYIFKRTLLNKKYNSASIFKGSNQQSGGGAFICDYNSVEPDLLTQGYSFGAGLYVDSLNADSIVYGTRGSVNGTKITAGNNTDTEGLTVGKWRAYKEMVFYKLFLYPRTVNMLSINMVKNMMEEDGIIDLTSKLFTDKYTGDFYEMDFNNDFLIGN